MERNTKYLTVKGRTEGLYKEKGSKFIGIAAPCTTTDEVRELLDSWNREHHQARHLCYAYRFGPDGEKYRANDDGEPNNSAGAPILGQLQSFEVTNTLIGVVRYYGGTKLGVGGLINAYRTAAKEALEIATIVEREIYEWVDVYFDYSDMPFVMNLLKRFKLEMTQQNFEESCRLRTNLNLNLAEDIKAELNKLASVELKILGIY